jgi:two-component system nitrate/nitrite response regulator NarL
MNAGTTHASHASLVSDFPHNIIDGFAELAHKRAILSMKNTNSASLPGGGVQRAELTDRERQIIGLVSEGLSNKQIARRLKVTEGTVKVHLHNVFHKLEVSKRTALVRVHYSLQDQSDHE